MEQNHLKENDSKYKKRKTHENKRNRKGTEKKVKRRNIAREITSSQHNDTRKKKRIKSDRNSKEEHSIRIGRKSLPQKDPQHKKS